MLPDPCLTSSASARLCVLLCRRVLADLGSRISKPSEVLTAKSKGSMALEAVGIGFALLMIGFGAYYGRKYTKDIMDKRAGEAQASGLEEGGVKEGEGKKEPSGAKVAPGRVEMRANAAT